MKNIAVIYARLSREDEDKIDGNHESRSIENQIKTLTDYAKEQGFEVAKVYYDDGYSGANQNRPDFQAMLSDMKKHKFNILLVKDISRLGRMLHQVGELIEKTFPEYNIRVISVNDNYDSAKYSQEESIVLRNFLNDYYLKDFRKKCKKALIHRANTKHLNYYPKFGYNFDGKGNEMIDEYSASIVRYIFEQALQGKSTVKIAELLNARSVPTRSQYATQVLGLKPLNKTPASKWNAEKVWEILTDYEYCGHSVNLVRHKQPVVLKNTHLAIIDEDMFNEVKNLIAKRDNGSGKFNKLSIGSILIDKKTQKHLSYCTKAKEPYYYSHSPNYYSVPVKTLHKILLGDLNAVVMKYAESDELIEDLFRQRKKSGELQDISKLQNQLALYNGEFQRLFEKSIQNKISKTEYEMKSNELKLKIGEIEKQIERYHEYQSEFAIFKLKFKKVVESIVKDCKDEVDVIKQAISAVYVNRTEDKKFNIDIVYKFEEI